MQILKKNSLFFCIDIYKRSLILAMLSKSLLFNLLLSNRKKKAKILERKSHSTISSLYGSCGKVVKIILTNGFRANTTATGSASL